MRFSDGCRVAGSVLNQVFGGHHETHGTQFPPFYRTRHGSSKRPGLCQCSSINGASPPDNSGDDTKQVLITSGEFAPGVTLPHHKHPGDDYTVVRQGTLELHVEGREPQRVSAGQAFHVPPETVHYVRVLGDTPVRIVAFWVLDKGKQPMQVVPE